MSLLFSGVTVADTTRMMALEPLHERCAGFYVPQETVLCCLLIGEPGGRCRQAVRTFGTMTADLEALRDWLTTCGVTHVAMESTGISWKPVSPVLPSPRCSRLPGAPVSPVLEGQVEVSVGNARHMRNGPGRKTDLKDAEGLAPLLRPGLIRPSFVPPPEIRERRERLRFRRGRVQEVPGGAIG